MQRVWKSGFSVLLGAIALLGARSASASSQGCQYAACTSVAGVAQSFAAGSRWSFRIEKCPCEGLVIAHAYYTPAGGAPVQVLTRASLAQINVPYTVGGPRLVDVTHHSSGLGNSAIALSPAECSGGTLYAGGTICKNVEDRGYAWKYTSNYLAGEKVSVFMASQLGRYTYINRWELHDDGTIVPMVGLTGWIQFYGDGAAYEPYGSRLNPESAATPQYGLTHLHNLYYRLDFDLAGYQDDAIERMTLEPSALPSPVATCSTPGECWINSATQLPVEAAEDLVPAAYTAWRVYDKRILNSDGRTIGYELIPNIMGLWSGMTSTTEPWSSHEVWVTRYNQCESLATDNHPPHIAPGCTGAADSVSAMVNSQSVDGADLVVWYANRLLHVPRDEDETDMPIMWTSFALRPRGLRHRNPLEP